MTVTKNKVETIIRINMKTVHRCTFFMPFDSFCVKCLKKYKCKICWFLNGKLQNSVLKYICIIATISSLFIGNHFNFHSTLRSFVLRSGLSFFQNKNLYLISSCLLYLVYVFACIIFCKLCLNSQLWLKHTHKKNQNFYISTYFFTIVLCLDCLCPHKSIPVYILSLTYDE